MEAKETDTVSGFRKKVYTKMYNSSMSQIKADCEKPRKKIVPTSKKLGMREEFKKTFLPLLIDVFELRQMIHNYKSNNSSTLLLKLENKPLPPKKILTRLKELQEDIAESKRWVEGVITQIDKGIEEAREALEIINHEEEKALKLVTKKNQAFSNKIKLEMGDLLDQKHSASKLFNRLFKKKKKYNEHKS